jgi:hypothetical protein
MAALKSPLADLQLSAPRPSSALSPTTKSRVLNGKGKFAVGALGAAITHFRKPLWGLLYSCHRLEKAITSLSYDSFGIAGEGTWTEMECDGQKLRHRL